ncbi:MAG: hypothetical protein MUF03_10445 [Rubrivivax sp.]|jgi:hypothetical protein|nr:hypothetical protein [Rubrivivax sp.]
MLIAIWTVTLLLGLLWSLASWGLHALLSMDPGPLGDLKPMIDQIPHAAVIEQWIPGWREMLQLAVDATQWALGWVGSAAPVIAWGIWAVGLALLVGTALVLTLVVRLIRRKPATPVAA